MWINGGFFQHESAKMLAPSSRPRRAPVPTDAPAAFFSYSREDSGFALRLAQDLKAAGANVWLDQLDIQPGMRWDRAVEDALNSCPCMLVILSPVSVKSENVSDEVSFALSKQKTVIPVLYRECEVPFRVSRLQRIDFRTDYARSLKVLLRTLGVEPAAASESPNQAHKAVERRERAEAQKAREEAEAEDRAEAKRKARKKAEQEQRKTEAQEVLEEEEVEAPAAAENTQLVDEGRKAAKQPSLDAQRKLTFRGKIFTG